MDKKASIRKIFYVLIFLLGLIFLIISFNYLENTNIPILEPKGLIAQEEFNLIKFALILSLFVVVPVFTLLIVFLYRYRENNLNRKAKYDPEQDGNKYLEFIWWLIPSIIILILSIVTWISSHQLDPYKPIYSKIPTLNIEVVALDWKWLFIYPNQNIASVNFLELPVNRPIDFYITSDAPMNSFWIPQLAGQIYAMPGMSTQLHILANHIGEYTGWSANISGNGFSGMTFKVLVTKSLSFNNFVSTTSKIKHPLSVSAYNQLVKPSINNPVKLFSSVQPNLFSLIVAKYMSPSMNATIKLNKENVSN